MKTLKFRGYSDDTFGEYNVTKEDHDNCGNGSPITFEVKANGKTLFVTGQYSRFGNGTWGIDVAAGDDENLPNFPMSLSFEDDSAVLEIYVPDDFSLEYVKRTR